MTSNAAASHGTSSADALPIRRPNAAVRRDTTCGALAMAALIAGAGGALDPIIYRADLTLQVRAPADLEPAATSLEAEAQEAAVELSAATLEARVSADLARADPGRGSSRSAFDGWLAQGFFLGAPSGPQGVEVRLVRGTGRIHLSRLSFSPVQAPLVLNTVADEFVRVRVARVAAQEQRFAAALAEVEDQLLANAAAADHLMTGGGAADHDLLALAAPPAYSRLLADQYARMPPAPDVRAAASTPDAAAGDQDGRLEGLAQLRLRRAELAARYQPDAAPIRDLDAVIAALAPAAPPPAPAPSPKARPTTPRTAGEGRTAARAGLAALARKWSAARSLAPRLEQLERQAAVLRGDAQTLSAELARVRLRRVAGPSAGADVEVVERARVPAEGVSLRRPLVILALGLLGLCLVLRPRTRPATGAG